MKWRSNFTGKNQRSVWSVECGGGEERQQRNNAKVGVCVCVGVPCVGNKLPSLSLHLYSLTTHLFTSFVLSRLVLSRLVLSCLVLSCLVLSRLVLSRLVLSRLVLSCLVLSCLVSSCLVLSCLVSLMSTLEEEIRDLKAEIVKNTVRFDKAVDEGNEEDREKMYADLIIASKKTLNLLLQQQSQAQAQGE